MDIKGKVIEIVAQVCEVENKVITETSTIGDFPQWDSVGHLTILASIEDVFEINFEPEEMMDIEDVKDIIEAVNKKLK
ncbi:MAG: acyl carrier protein [Bacteroidales bacterium]